MKKNIPSSLPVYFGSLLLGFSLILSSCKYQEVTLGQISGLKVNKITKEGVEMEIGMKINNPNSYGFTVFPSSFQVKLSGTDMGTARLNHRVHIKAHSDEIHTFVVKTSYNQLMQGGLPGMIGLFSQKNAQLEIKGNLKAGKFLFRKKIPIDRKQNTRMENNAGGGLFNMN
ncbi:MAG TPA: LEA type 2 family protein [Bacteroidia bacterium]|jgi:LEA14-like dessication related protein|nr:LEA type 2 family protein [Bacteroidia bacterium]